MPRKFGTRRALFPLPITPLEYRQSLPGYFVTWAMQERAGTTVIASSNTAGLNGTNTGAVVGVTTGLPLGWSYQVGAGDYIDVSSAAFNAGFNPDLFTVMISGLSDGATGSDQYLMRLESGSAADDLRLRESSAGAGLPIYYRGSTPYNLAYTVPSSIYTLAITVDATPGTMELRLFLNGVQSGLTQTLTSAWGGGAINASIGSSSAAAALNIFNGRLTMASVFNAALTPAQILQSARIDGVA
jgi:hypothetical protein